MQIKATTVRPGDTLLTSASQGILVDPKEDSGLTEYIEDGRYVIDVVGVRWEGRNTLRIDGAIWTGDPEHKGETIRKSVFLYLLENEKVDRL